MFEIVLYLLFTLLLVVGISKKKKIDANLLSKESTLYLRGVFAVEILIGHIAQITKSHYLFPYEKAMICSVGVFFLFSGYGLSYSYQEKEGYFKNYKKRFISTLIPIFYCAIFVCIIQKLQVQFFDLINWYIIEQLLFYVLFYIFFKYMKRYHALLSITASIVVIIIIFFCFNIHKSWYVSSLCFPLGIWLNTYQNNIIKLIKNYYKSLLLVVSVVFLLSSSCMFIAVENFFSVAIARNMATMTFSILIIILTARIQIGNKLLRLLGTLSFEIYIYHIALMKPLWDIIQNIPIYVITLFTLTLCLAYLMNKINTMTIKNIYERIK